MSQTNDPRIEPMIDATLLWSTIYGEGYGMLGLFAGKRPRQDVKRRLTSLRTAFFRYPDEADEAARWSYAVSEQGFESYFCAHLLTSCRRKKEAAAPVLTLWADADGPVPAHAPDPTAIVESSPGRAHLFWRLRRPLSPTAAEALNRRLALSLSADPSGWDLSQLLRPPGTRNLKYEAAPTVQLVDLDKGAVYHPRELDLALPLLPEVPDQQPQVGVPGSRPLRESPSITGPYQNELSRLSSRALNLIRAGNAGVGKPYQSRSEADFATCLAMFSAGYEESAVRAVLTDPANGISEKYQEKGRHAESYLALTLRKARLYARGPGLRPKTRQETRPTKIGQKI